MPTLLGDARIRIRPDMTGFRQTVTREVDSSGKEATKHVSGIGKALGGAGAAFAGLALVEGIHSVVDAARESNRVAAQTASVLKSTGGVANVTADQVSALATAISNKTGVDDEAIQSGENLLLTFTGVRNEVGKGNDIFNQATSVVTDMSVALGQDMKSSAIQLGKALNDPIKGVTALQRVGVTFTAQQKEQIAVLIKSGNVLGAQKIILAELNKEFGGSAANAMTPADRLSVTMGNLAEQAGNVLIPVLDKLATVMVDDIVPVLSTALSAFSDIPAPVIAMGVALAGVYGIARVGTTAFKHLKEIQEVVTQLTGAFAVKEAEAAVAEGAQAAGAEAAAVSTSKLGGAASTAGAAVGKMAGKGALLGAVAGLALLSDQVTKYQASSEVATVKTNDLAKGLIDLNNDTLDHSAVLKLASNDMNIFGRGVTSGSDALQTFGDLAHGAFSQGLTDIIGRAQSGSERMDRFKDVAGQLDDALANMASTGHAADAVQFLQELKDKSHLSDEEFQHALNLLPKYNSLMGGTAQATSTTAAATNDLKNKEADAADKTKGLTGAIKDINSALQASNNEFLQGRSVENAYYAAMDEVTAAVKTNGKTLDVHTAKGRANRDALDKVSAASLGVLAATKDNVKASPAFIGIMNTQRDHIIVAAEKFGLSKTAAKKYADQILATPKSVATKVQLTQLQQVQNDLRKLQLQITAMKGQNLEVVIDSHGTALLRDTSHAGKKDGGYITGPGGPRDDKAGLFKLSDGEFVVNASATSQHRPLLEAINAKGYKDGGVVNNTLGVHLKDHMPDPGWVSRFLTRRLNPDALFGGGGPVPGGSGVARWGPMMHRALAASGLPQSLWGNEMRQIGTESGGNPNAIQGDIGDVNNASGDLAKGLLQVIGATFRAFHVPGTSFNVFDGWANMMASLNYQKSRYGSSISAVIGHGHGYAGGTPRASKGLAMVGENGRELVDFGGGGQRVHSNRDTEALLSPEITVRVYIGERELTDIVDTRVDVGNRKLAQALSRGRR